MTLVRDFRSMKPAEGLAKKLDNYGDVLVSEIDDSHKAEALLRSIFEGTASITGPGFFDAAVQSLAGALGSHTAFISEPIPTRPGWNRLTAHWADGKHAELLEYDIDGTPCAVVATQELTIINDVGRDFPDDEWLMDLSAETYVAITLRDTRDRRLGHLGVVHTDALPLSSNELASIRIFAARISAELERLRADLEISKISDLQQRMFSSGPFGVTTRDLTTGAVWSNDRFAEIAGRSFEQCIAAGWAELIHHEDLDVFLDATRRLDTLGEPVNMTLRLLHSDGVPRWIQIHVAASFDHLGRPVETTGFAIDITKERTAQEDLVTAASRLEAREAELESSLTASHDLRFRLTGDGTFVSVWTANPGALVLPPNELVGANISSLFDPTLAGRMQQAITKTIRNSEVSRIGYRLGEGDNAVDYEAHIAPLGDDDVMVVVRDVTHVKALEQQLVHAGTMQSVGRLAGGIAHDFNNVLHVLRGHATALTRHHDEPDELDRRVEAITTAIDRTSSLIDRLMTISRPTPNNPTASVIDALLETMGPALNQLLGDTIEVEFSLASNGAAVVIDDSRFENVVLNLAANASDAMPEGGTFRMETSSPESDSMTIVISDTGSGIEGDNLSSVFEPFFTTKTPGTGTGLGLATTYSTVTAAGGTITADSSVGIGTTFTIQLPITSVSSESISQPKSQSSELSTDGTILLVEDEAEVLELCADSLRDLGYRVLEALSGADALALIDSGEVPDLVLTDVVMPNMTGPELRSQLNARDPRLPVVFMSGYAADTPTVDGKTESILRKPFSDFELANFVAASSRGISCEDPAQ